MNPRLFPGTTLIAMVFAIASGGCSHGTGATATTTVGTVPWSPPSVDAGALDAAIPSGDATPDSDATATTVDETPEPEIDVASRTMPATVGTLGKTFAETRRIWHQEPDILPPRTLEGRPYLVLEAINTRERAELSPMRDDGGFSSADLELAAYVLRDQRTNRVSSMDARLVDLAYQIQLHFDAKVIRVLSAYRVARRRPSNHSRGRAIDLVVPGHRDAEVAAFARTIGFVGVGLYPMTGFVHLDTRKQSFFWVDWSGPGQRSRIRQVAAKLAAESDANALARGQAVSGEESTEEDSSEETAAGKTFNTSTATPRVEAGP